MPPSRWGHTHPLYLSAKACSKYNNMRLRRGVMMLNSHQKLNVANMIELLLESFLVYHSPMFEAWKVPKRLVEVSCDITQHLLAYLTAVGNRTNSSGMRTHTG